MSTARLFPLVAPLSVLVGCAETCLPPQAALNGIVWEMFGHVVSFDQPPPDEWPAESNPINGHHTWLVSWSSSGYESGVVVTIDGQEFAGTGVYDEIDCGNFSMVFSGSYLGEDGSEHAFVNTARMVVWPGHLDGFVEFETAWQNPDGVLGATNGSAQLAGTGP